MKAHEKRAVVAGLAGLTFGSGSVWVTSDSFYAAMMTLVIGIVLGTAVFFLVRSLVSTNDRG